MRSSHHCLFCSLLLVSLWSATAWGAPPGAADPVQAQAQAMARQVAQQRGGALTLGSVYDTLAMLEHLDTGAKAKLLETLRQTRLHPLAQAALAQQEARLLLDQNKPAQARALLDKHGFVRSWQVIGPFDNKAGLGLDQVYGPEIALTTDKGSAGRLGEVTWRSLDNRDFVGAIDLESMIRPAQGSVAYAAVILRAPKAQDALLHVGAQMSYKFWLGDTLSGLSRDDLGGGLDRDAWAVKLNKGDNLLLLKIANDEDSFSFSLRLTDRKGAPLKNVTAVHDAKVIQAAAPPPGTDQSPSFALRPDEEVLAAAAPSALDLQTQAAQALSDKRPGPKALALARTALMAKTLRPRDSQEPWLPLLDKARALSPTPEVLRIASGLYQEMWRRIDALERANQEPGAGPWLRYLRTALLYQATGDVHITQAKALMEDLLKEHPGFVAPQLLKIKYLTDEGLTQSAFALADKLAKAHPTHPAVLRAAFAASESAMRPQRQSQLCQQQMQLEASRVTLYGPCASAWLKQADTDRARAALAQAIAVRPDIVGFEGLAADIEIAASNPAGAEAHLQTMTRTVPHDAGAWSRLGLYHLEHGSQDKAMKALNQALALEPQNTALQEYVAYLGPREPSVEESYVMEIPTLTPEQEKTRYGTWDSFYLVDQQVTRVYDNGLSSRFIQQVIKVRTDVGVGNRRNFQISYTPGEESVDIIKVRVTREDGTTRELYSVYEQSLSEPWYNLYYDYRAMILSFPELGPGDTLEVQYKINQTTAQNYLGDYFGDIWFVQDSAPKASARYVLLTPPERPIYARQPTTKGCTSAEATTEQNLTMRAWTCQQVPGIKAEQRTPGFSQIADYLHLSTYEDWSGIARWYWDLIKDQLVVDDEIRRIVDQETKDLTDDRAKVSAIHNYVVKNTRYVGLEFGIHGFKPYRTTLCLRRRFGDCKDKASLLKVMLEEAGIDADLVLIRTRNNGAIDNSPASLQIFDHAITYVPAFDLFLDGTAEYSGTRELPWGDQGSQVLLVKNGGKFEVRKAPVLGPKRNAVLSTMSIDLTGDVGKVDVSTTMVGGFAASARRRYETEKDRKEQFTRGLSEDFPGARVESLEFSDLTQLERDVKLAYRFSSDRIAEADVKQMRILPALRPSNLLQRMAPWTRREQPLELGSPFLNQETYIIRPKAGSKLTSKPDDVELNSKFGAFSLRIRPNMDTKGAPQEIRVEMTLSLHTPTVQPNDYPALRTWLGQIDQILETSLVLER